MTPKSAMFELRSRLARRLGRLVRLLLMLYAVLVLALLGAAVLALNLGWYCFRAGASQRGAIWAALALLTGWAGIYLVILAAQPLPAPSGIRVPRHLTPDLDRALTRIAHRLGACRVEVWITPDMNATLLQRPAWGSLGPIRSHLLLGLPLVHCVSAAQLEAILAHELAHLARQRSGRDAVDAYLRALWVRVLDQGCLPAVLERAFGCYCRDLLRLSRLEEFEADALAASVVGPARMGAALIEVGLKARFLDVDYWPTVQACNRRWPWRAQHPYREMGRQVETALLRNGVSPEQLCAEEQGLSGLHPGLRQRLRMLHAPLDVGPSAGPSAARHYFSALLPDVAWVFDLIWRASAREARVRNRRASVRMRRVETKDIPGQEGYRR